jgi:hypothetical protein
LQRRVADEELPGDASVPHVEAPLDDGPPLRGVLDEENAARYRRITEVHGRAG